MRTLERAGSATLTFEGRSRPTVVRTPNPTTIVVAPARIARMMLVVVASLTGLSLAGQFAKYFLGHDQLFGLIHLFNVSHEGNLPTWYSSVSLLVAAVLLGFIAVDERARHGRRTEYWAGLSLLLLYVAIDEGSRIHELLNEPLRAVFHTHGLLYYPAAAVGASVAIVLAAIYARFLWSLPRATRVLFVVAAAVYLGGALGVEAISARHAERFGQENMTYALITTGEELAEMTGVVIFIYALLSYMSRSAGPFVLAVRRPAP